MRRTERYQFRKSEPIQSSDFSFIMAKTGAPGRNRTCNLRIRSPALYPIELQAHKNRNRVELIIAENKEKASIFLPRIKKIMAYYCTNARAIIWRHNKSILSHYRQRWNELCTIVVIRNEILKERELMLGLLYAIEFILSIIVSSTYNTILPSNQPYVTVFAAGTQTISSQKDNDLAEQCKRFQQQLSKVRIIMTKKLQISQSYRIYEKKLEKIEKNFQDLQAEYEKLSPATVILGPIGAIATVLKEQRIANNLIIYLQELANILTHAAEQTKEQVAPMILKHSLEKALDQMDLIIANSDSSEKLALCSYLSPHHP